GASSRDARNLRTSARPYSEPDGPNCEREKELRAGLSAHEQLREFWEGGNHFDQLTEFRKLDRDIRTYMREVLNVLGEASLAAATRAEVGEYIKNGAHSYLSAAYALLNPKDLPFLDRHAIDRSLHSACRALIQTATARHTFLRDPRPAP